VLINWFSPLPPARSGIAHYATQVLPNLARAHEVVLWTDQDQVAGDVGRMARVAHYNPSAPPWREINNGAVSIYHLGNDPGFHAGIWQVCSRQPGIVVLHDLYLHDFFSMGLGHQEENRGSYLAVMERWYGPEGRRAAEAFCAGGISPEEMAQSHPLVRAAVRNALGVITHTRHTPDELSEAPCPVAALDLPYVASKSPVREGAAARPAGEPFRLITFGYLNRNRRLGSLLEALAGMAERDQFRLDICGQIWDESHLRHEIDRLGLTSLVSLHGFLPENQLHQKILAANLAINLRYPSMGEASLSQLQYWDYGLPTLVTRTGWYASLPEEAAAFVRPEHEIADIQASLRAFLADPGAFRVMGERGRRLLKDHDPARYVAAMTTLVDEALRFSPRLSALMLANRVGADMRAWLHPVASAYLLEMASKEIGALLVRDAQDSI
jgi:glycosyltransferase involved in cell wall biosynthesis